MKTKDQLKPNHGPVYAAAMYPDLAAICHNHGYALAVHGSLARDLDLIAIPWVPDDVSSPEAVIEQITKDFAVRVTGEVGEKPHGRRVWTLVCGFGNCCIDLGFMRRDE